VDEHEDWKLAGHRSEFRRAKKERKMKTLSGGAVRRKRIQ
jgi:hypothetical protein